MGFGEIDFYKILGVSRDAEFEEIEAAYQRMRHLYHPDHNKEIFAGRIFIQVNQAYEILSNPVRKKTYDEKLRTAVTEVKNKESDDTDDINGPPEFEDLFLFRHILRIKSLISFLMSAFSVGLLTYLTVFWMHWVNFEIMRDILLRAFFLTATGWIIFMVLRIYVYPRKFHLLLFNSFVVCGFIYLGFLMTCMRKQYLDDWFARRGREGCFLLLGTAFLVYTLSAAAIFPERGDFITNFMFIFSKENAEKCLRESFFFYKNRNYENRDKNES